MPHMSNLPWLSFYLLTFILILIYITILSTLSKPILPSNSTKMSEKNSQSTQWTW